MFIRLRISIQHPAFSIQRPVQTSIVPVNDVAPISTVPQVTRANAARRRCSSAFGAKCPKAKFASCTECWMLNAAHRLNDPNPTKAPPFSRHNKRINVANRTPVFS